MIHRIVSSLVRARPLMCAMQAKNVMRTTTAMVSSLRPRYHRKSYLCLEDPDVCRNVGVFRF